MNTNFTSQRFHMRNRHSQNRQLIRFSSQGAAGRHHIAQLGDVGRHFVATSPLNFTMILSTAKAQAKQADKVE